MCSISGVINGTGTDNMLRAQKHRAPDEEGVFKDEHIELGMGRLKIIDLKSDGLAPYQEDGLVLCYNGEIYNYSELREELRTHDWKFRTSSDTEVLLKAWRQWGLKMFERLNGMFAFAIYDSKRQKLFMARDIAGEKPLYYTQRGKMFAFTSEAKAFYHLMPQHYQENEFFDAFQHCHITTLWRNVYELPPASCLEYDLNNGQFTVGPYWQFSPRSIKLKTAVEELESILEDAVKIRTRSDVPYGLYYSGGIDSSLISSLYNFEEQFHFDDGNDWRDDFFASISSIVKHLDFPVGSLSSYPLWKLAQLACSKVKVVLSGEGADEIFGGYVRYLPIAREWELRTRYPSYGYIFGKYYPPYLDGFTRITARNNNFDFVREQLRPYFEMFSDPINAMGFADFKLVMPSLMQMGDRMAGAFGLENRCPFLDKRVIEFGFSLSPEFKVRQLDQKIILRKILKKRGLLAPLRDEKKGLTIHFNKWFGKNDWDRSIYFTLLKKEWYKVYDRRLCSGPCQEY